LHTLAMMEKLLFLLPSAICHLPYLLDNAMFYAD
jgi:hypothetical protein